MKKYKIYRILCMFACVLITANSIAQQNKWVLPPHRWIVSSGAPAATTLPYGSSDPYITANGVYDADGNMMFYVKDRAIYNPYSSGGGGLYVGDLLPYYSYGYPVTPNGFGNQNEYNFEEIGPEMSIVPVPGSCSQFYIIYTMTNGFTAYQHLLYMKVDCSTGIPVLSSPTATPGMPINNINSSALSAGGGLAVSHTIAANARYLFLGGRGSIQRYKISSTGIGSQTTFSSATDEPSIFSIGANLSHELELSPDQQWLAWGNTVTGKLNVLKMNSSYTKIAGTKTYTIANIEGLEFNEFSTRIYTSSTGNGISYSDLSGTTTSHIASSLSMNNTYLELAKNEFMYGVNNSGQLVPIFDSSIPSLGTAITSPLVYSNGTNHGLYAEITYHLPNQIDGEDHDYFFGVKKPIAGFKVNGIDASSCAGSTPLFSCASYAMTMNNTSLNATSYKIDVYRSTTQCGSYSLVHSTGVVTTFPSNLKSLPGGATGTYIANNPGFYQIRLTAYNTCSFATGYTQYISVTASPTSASAAFKTKVITKPLQTLSVVTSTSPLTTCSVGENKEIIYQDLTSGPSCGGVGGYKFAMQHTSVASPNDVGRLNTSFDLSGVTAGTGSSLYTIYVKTDKWDSGTSTWINMDDVVNYPLGEVLGGVSTLSLVGLVSYDPASPYYEAFTNSGLTPNNSIYRITITVQNECATIASSQIIRLNTVQLKSGKINADHEEMDEVSVVSYPNPANDKVFFDLVAAENETVSIAIFDMSGRLCQQVVENVKTVAGENTYQVSTSELTSGAYIYTVRLDGKMFQGKIIKN